jgi:hypothetical protein
MVLLRKRLGLICFEQLMLTRLLPSQFTTSITFSDMQYHSNHTDKHPAAPSHEAKAQSLLIHAQVSAPSKATAAGTSCILFQLGKGLLERSMQTLLPADKAT